MKYTTSFKKAVLRKESRLAKRREKLHTVDINRKAYWLQQQQA